MTADFRALCVELLDCLEKADWPHKQKHVFKQWVSIARKALAEPDGPAVPEGREPASVAMQPTDEEIEEWADACPEAPLEEMDPEVHGWRRCFTAKEFSETIRAVLARWAHPAAAPVPDFGEVAAALKVIDKMQQEWVLLGNDDDGTASPSLSMPISLRRFTVLRDALSRAATLLQQQAAPVPVSERLPGDALCWFYEPDEDDDGSGYGGNWTLLRIRGGVSCYTHWLPANALPLPAPEGGEVEGANG